MFVLRKKTTTKEEKNGNISCNFSLDELKAALVCLKSGKAIDFDEIHPELIKNTEKETKK
jgi:Fe2+ or Zn2+ uptake regulation protein